MGRHRDVNLREINGLLDRIGGKAGLKLILCHSRTQEWCSFDDPKYGNLTLGEIEEIFNFLVKAGGPDVLKMMRKKELVVKFVVGDVYNKNRGKRYDRYGRVIAPRGLFDRPLCADRTFNLTLSDVREWHNFNLESLNLVEHFDRIRPFVPSDCGITLPNREEIVQSLVYCEGIRNRLRADEAQKNILRGAHLPTILPKCDVANHGALVDILSTIARRSYETHFKGRKFYKLTGQLVGKVCIASESRFIEIRNRMSQEFVPGLTFFTPFQGYSISASRQIINLLPEECALSCFDTIWNFAVYPEILLSDSDKPGYDFAGFSVGFGSLSICGEVTSSTANLKGRDRGAFSHCSSGLFLSR